MLTGMAALEDFHPAVRSWFEGRFGTATPAQEQAWPALKQGKNVLVAAPTGLHAEVAIPLLKQGVDLLIEKPLAASVEDARAIVVTARRFGRTVAVELDVEFLRPVPEHVRERAGDALDQRVLGHTGLVRVARALGRVGAARREADRRRERQDS